MKSKADDLGRQADSSDLMDHAVRLGLVAYGVVNLMVGWLALQLALGNHDGKASSSGALRELAQQSFGSVLIWTIAVGMFLLVLWRGVEALAGHRDSDGGERLRKRLTSAGKGVIYAAVGVSAVQIATHSGGSKGKSGSDTMTAKLMDLPGGQAIVVIVGLAIIGYGASQVWHAYTEKFRKHLDSEGNSGQASRAYVVFGKVGYTAKGVAVGLVGSLFVYAGLTHSAKKSGGLDVALAKVLQAPLGPVLLGAIAIGIGCYGLFCFARARHLSR